jgi:hypothetical protein
MTSSTSTGGDRGRGEFLWQTSRWRWDHVVNKVIVVRLGLFVLGLDPRWVFLGPLTAWQSLPRVEKG